jgi:hypothetical protein
MTEARDERRNVLEAELDPELLEREQPLQVIGHGQGTELRANGSRL